MAEAPQFHVVPTPDLIEAWSTFRLPFQPKGEALELRTEIRTGISRLKRVPDRILDCTYRSADKAFVDTENVLIYNVGEACFSGVAAHGIRFERVFCEPPDSPETLQHPGARHYVAYKTAVATADFTHWRRGKSVATWTNAAWPSRAATSPTPFWLALRASDPQRIAPLQERTTRIGLRVVVAGGGEQVEPAKVIKPLFDGAVSAFHVHAEPAMMRTAVERLAADGWGDAVALERLLRDPRFNLLGPRDLVAPYRNSVKWNPEDERCVLGELVWTPGPGARRFSGELFEVVPKATQ